MPKKEPEMAGKVEKQEAPKTRRGVLARRARSFKEDLLERFTQMRNPTTSARSASPCKASPRSKHKHGDPVRVCTGGDVAGGTGGGGNGTIPVAESPARKSEKDVHQLQRDVQVSLRYFQDVVDKNLLEMLAGSATVVLETVLAIHTMLKNCLSNEQSSLLLSTTNQVYQSLANLVRWADNVLLHGDRAQNKENVAEVVRAVQEAIKTLVQLAEDKLHTKETKGNGTSVHNGVYSLKPESPKRTSLPDIPLTPREKEILEQTSFGALDDSGIHWTSTPSSDSLLNDTNSSESINDSEVPPPKPPLPNNWDPNWLHVRYPSAGNVLDVIPPLPPKRKAHNASDGAMGTLQSSSWNGNVSPLSSSPHTLTTMSGPHRTNSAEWTSPLSVSPDSASPLSASASSLDSVLNRSAEDLLSVGPQPVPPSPLTSGHMINSQEVHHSQFHSSSSYLCGYKSSTEAWTGIASDASSAAAKDLHQLHMRLQELNCQPATDPSGVASDGSSSSGVFSGINSAASSSFSIQSNSCMLTSATSISSASRTASGTSIQIHNNGKSASSNTTSSSSTTQRTESISVHTSSCNSTTEALWASLEQVASGTAEFPSPPAIPPKRRNPHRRTPSQYDNVPDVQVHDSSEDQSDSSSPLHHRQHFEFANCTRHTEFRLFQGEDGKPPPLPPKKKHIMAYMEMFGNYSEPSKNEFFRHSLHTYNLLQAQWQQQQCEMSFMHMRSLGNIHLRVSSDELISSAESSFLERLSAESELIAPSPPALPPKRNRTVSSSHRTRPSTSPTNPSPPMYELKEKSASMIEDSNGFPEKELSKQVPVVASRQADLVKPEHRSHSDDSAFIEAAPLEDLDVEMYLVYKKSGEEGPDIRGGSTDALIVRATKVNKNDFMYQEAFLTTYRTFITPLDLIKKLLHRYNKFNIMSEVTRQRAARNAFALLVRVVDDLCVSDVEDITMETLMDFVFHLLCNGDLILARALRKKILEKHETKKRASVHSNVLLPSLTVTTNQLTLLDFKSGQLAEQMTLLDADLFQKIEIPEVLIWAREQSEELSPNLTTFTEHFNKMSYWARSRILEQNDAKDRERYVVKFIKIMKHLRKLNNFNSYLAILSALDSAPIRRLEWQKHITEGLKEYCELIDSSSSFRAYRQALAETEPPCIPYIGLILQDLTFVHIGNCDVLPDSNINFSKRWQQFNILDNMRRFKKCNYNFKRNDKIIAFFNNFNDYLCEEAMWQISESIKPRGGKKKVDQT